MTAEPVKIRPDDSQTTPNDSHKPNQPRRRSAYSPWAWLVMLLVLALGLTIDLWSKSYAFAHVADVPIHIDRDRVLNDPNYRLPSHESVVLIPGDILNARLVWNYGAVFGLGQKKRIFFIAFTSVAIAVGVLLFAIWTRERQTLAHIAIGLILAGGLGNLYDRIRFGVVRDFLHMLPEARLPFGWTWPGGSPELFPWVFNIADTLLLLGMLLLMIHINRSENRRQKEDSSQEQDETKMHTASERE